MPAIGRRLRSLVRRPGGPTWILAALLLLVVLAAACGVTVPATQHAQPFPRPLQDYEATVGIWDTLVARVAADPLNLVAAVIFFLAIIHTFLTSRFQAVGRRLAEAHAAKVARGEATRHSVAHRAEVMQLLGEVEVVFGFWAVPLTIAITAFHGWGAAIHYLADTVNYTEPAFVVVIMTLAATRPILRLAEAIITGIARLFGGSLKALWFTTLTVGALLGSLITEPAAITLSALVLGRMVYSLNPSTRLKYGTLGLLLVDVSVGGTLTNFAAPPVLMVADAWDWSMGHMLLTFGWKAALGIVICNVLYLVHFRRELAALEDQYRAVQLKHEIERRYLRRADVDARFDHARKSFSAEDGTHLEVQRQIEDLTGRIRAELEAQLLPKLRQRGLDEAIIQQAFDRRFEQVRLREVRRLVPVVLPADERAPFKDPDWDNRDDPVPVWVTVVHAGFMVWAIMNAHHAPLFILGLLFFMGFAAVTEDYQNRVDLKPAMLVGFFLAGLVIHGGVQGWWIQPLLGNLGELPLMAMATGLTAFNDNSAITYLATLVPNFSDALKYAVVAGAVTGGGLTIIANAPNPAAVSLLRKYFDGGVSPLGLVRWALAPTVILFLVFWILR